jgi:hypothetical protein
MRLNYPDGAILRIQPARHFSTARLSTATQLTRDISQETPVPPYRSPCYEAPKLSAMYDYGAHNVADLKQMFRAIDTKFLKDKEKMVAYLKKWDREHAPRVAAYIDPPPKKNTGRRANPNWKPKEKANPKPAPPAATASDAPRQKRKRKEPSPAPASVPTTRAKRQKTVGQDVMSGDGKTARLKSEDARIDDDDEDEEMADAPDKQLPARPKKKLTIRKPASPVVPRDGEGYTAPAPPEVSLNLKARKPLSAAVIEHRKKVAEEEFAKMMAEVEAYVLSRQVDASVSNRDETQSILSKQGEIQERRARGTGRQSRTVTPNIAESHSMVTDTSSEQPQPAGAPQMATGVLATKIDATPTDAAQTRATASEESDTDLADDEDEPEDFNDKADETPVPRGPMHTMGAPRLKNEEYPNASPGRYVSEQVSKDWPAIHHIYQEIHSESEEEEKRVPIGMLGYDEYLKRARKIRRRNGEASPEKFMGGDIYQEDELEEKYAKLKEVKRRRKETARLEAEARAKAEGSAGNHSIAEAEVDTEGNK